MERTIDFWRARHMLCGCGHQFLVSVRELRGWHEGGEECPACALPCTEPGSAKPTVDPGDVALDSAQVSSLYWYHTSTQPDWPTTDFDPTREWDDLTHQRMERLGGGVQAWRERQLAKALHVGTYEAAIHNMLRRMVDQADSESPFYLYRVHLKPSVVVRSDWLPDVGGLVGDVPLAELCPGGVDVARYVNDHEDPGSLSLALGRTAITSVQRVAIPLEGAPADTEGDVETLASLLPDNLQDKFLSGSTGSGGHPNEVRHRAHRIAQLILRSGTAVARLNSAERRAV